MAADIDDALAEIDDPELEGARAELARTRDAVALAVIALHREISRRADWRHWVTRRPALALTVAFGIGFFIGSRRR